MNLVRGWGAEETIQPKTITEEGKHIGKHFKMFLLSYHITTVC